MPDQRLRRPSPTHPLGLLAKAPMFLSSAARPSCLVWLIPLLLIVIACGGRGAESSNSDDAATSENAAGEAEESLDDLPPVEVVSLVRGRIEAVLRFSTNLEAESEVQVFSQAARQITKLLVEEGDKVRKGQVLLQLQDEEQRSALAKAESQLRKAEREYERQRSLFSQELISEQDFNNATYEVEQLQLAVEDAKRNLGYTEVRAPIRGTITRRAVNLGDQITVNQHLFDIVDFDSIVARVYVPEREIGRLALGQAARLFADSLEGVEPVGEVMRIAPVVDPKSGTVKVTVDVPVDQGLLPGMYIEVELVTNVHEDALLVPKRAVVYDNNRAFLYRLLDDHTVQQTFFEVVLSDRDHVEPRGDRLAVGHRVVAAGQAGLKDGAKVRLASGVDEASPEAASSEAASSLADERASVSEGDNAEDAR